MKKTQKKIVLLDTHAIIHRAYHALPEFTSPSGEPTGALYGLAALLIKLIRDMQPDYIVACYDLPGPTFRDDMYKEYKAGRAEADDALIAQLVRSRDVYAAFNIPMYSLPGFEADDMLGTIVETLRPQFEKNELQVIVASGDMDTLQLVEGEQVVVYTLKKGINDTIVYTEEGVRARYGFAPKLLVDYKGLRGDPSDNIIGIAGIGEKTATDLITKFGSIEEIYKTLKKDREALIAAGIKERIVKLLEEGEDEALFSKTLASIRRDAPIAFALPEKTWRESFDLEAATKLCRELGFRSLLDRLGEWSAQATEVVAVPEVAPVEISLESDIFKKAAIAVWLLDSSKIEATPADIFDYTNKTTLESALADLETRIHKEGLTRVYEEIEVPLIPILNRAREIGIRVDKKYLENLSKTYHEELSRLEGEIWKHAGEEFNINSPKQLGVILFEKLGLAVKGLKKTAGGARSTKVSELEKLVGTHPIVDLIMSYREYQKLLSTYIDVLPSLADDHDRIHSTLVQAGAATGRMSSNNPNLQNIPIKTELGKNIRKAFISVPGFELVALDYSQIELRVLALLSGDEKLVKTFQAGEDIHTAVSMQVFGVDAAGVTSEMRRRAKVLNFGILYGMGVNAIRQNIGTSKEEAQLFYENYFKKFPKISEFIAATEALAEKQGYTTTYFGRRRYFPEINSRLPFMKSAALRMAVNAPVQGTAADIIKIAMTRADTALRKAGLLDDARLLLQVHDELVYEVKKEKREEAIQIIQKAMEGVMDTAVPFTVKVSVGNSWGNLNELT